MQRQHQGVNNGIICFEQLDDSEVISFIRQGDCQALDYLIQKYRGFVRVKASTYFLVGADHEDIVQEGMIGLYKAIRDYKDNRRSSFRAFAELCVTRQIITAIKTATRQKHIPLNSYVSLDKPIFDEESERTLLDVLTNVEKIDDPEELIINRESQGQVEGKLVKLLSRFECDVLYLYLDGRTYQEISIELNRHIKSIDNALQRVKRKLERYLDIASIKL
ncbi:RNA polymerase sporulation sigma factor SigH [Amphibacillus sp. Q70]|uniref:RNA polymerase sporulation sigma factor SigH n=1 Tax=Amphibacillus sp. Q70 TaxID=3453416 RepID=UPI003F83BD0F